MNPWSDLTSGQRHQIRDAHAQAKERKAEKLRNDCSVCGRSIQLKKDGAVRHHGGEEGTGWPYRRAYRCAGSGLPPKERTEENTDG